MNIVWIVFNEDPDLVHAVDASGNLLCAKEYVNCLEGPYQTLPSSHVQCGMCFSAHRKPKPVAKFNELSDEELATLGAEDLRLAYQKLRAHHIAETMALINRRNGICNHNWSVWAAAEGPTGEMRGYNRYCTEPGCKAREYSRYLQPMGVSTRTV